MDFHLKKFFTEHLCKKCTCQLQEYRAKSIKLIFERRMGKKILAGVIKIKMAPKQ